MGGRQIGVEEEFEVLGLQPFKGETTWGILWERTGASGYEEVKSKYSILDTNDTKL